jgi:hypothetical protein
MPPTVPAGRIVTLKGLMTVRRGGKVYRYVRTKGQPLSKRLPDLPTDSPEFLAAYAAARKAAAPTDDAGTLARLCTRAMTGRRWQAISPVYRQALRRHIEVIRLEYGPAKVAALRPAYLRADVDRATDQVARIKAWRWLFDGQDDNPAAGLKRPKRDRHGGNTPWTADDIARFRARGPIGTAARAAMASRRRSRKAGLNMSAGALWNGLWNAPATGVKICSQKASPNRAFISVFST